VIRLESHPPVQQKLFLPCPRPEEQHLEETLCPGLREVCKPSLSSVDETGGGASAVVNPWRCV